MRIAGCWIKGLVLFFVLLSFATIAGGIYLFAKNFDLKFNGVKTQGIFIDYVHSESQQTNRDQARYNQIDLHYFPVFRYEVNGDSITSQMKSGGDDAILFPGGLADIVYSPSDPSFYAFPQDVNQGMMVALLCTLMGLVVLFLTIYITKNFNKLKVDS
jgi:biopolymer transport protein ExbB/TolQ